MERGLTISAPQAADSGAGSCRKWNNAVLKKTKWIRWKS